MKRLLSLRDEDKSAVITYLWWKKTLKTRFEQKFLTPEFGASSRLMLELRSFTVFRVRCSVQAAETKRKDSAWNRFESRRLRPVVCGSRCTEVPQPMWRTSDLTIFRSLRSLVQRGKWIGSPIFDMGRTSYETAKKMLHGLELRRDIKTATPPASERGAAWKQFSITEYLKNWLWTCVQDKKTWFCILNKI